MERGMGEVDDGRPCEEVSKGRSAFYFGSRLFPLDFRQVKREFRISTRSTRGEGVEERERI